VLGPFEVLKRPLTLGPPDAPPPAAKTGAAASTPGLAAWWKLDESGGSTAADSSGRRLDAQVQGAPRWAPGAGRIGGALELGRADSFLDCGGAEEFNFRKAMTVSAWLKVGRADKRAPALVTKGNNTWALLFSGEKPALSFSLTGPQTTGTSRSRSPALKSKRPLDDAQWHHVAGVYDGQRIALYVDGELEDSVSASGPIAVNTEPVWVGQNSMGRSRPFNGWCDELRLYDRGLSAGEVQALYRGGAEAARASN
jgi:hypothetical protein